MPDTAPRFATRRRFSLAMSEGAHWPSRNPSRLSHVRSSIIKHRCRRILGPLFFDSWSMSSSLLAPCLSFVCLMAITIAHSVQSANRDKTDHTKTVVPQRSIGVSQPQKPPRNHTAPQTPPHDTTAARTTPRHHVMPRRRMTTRHSHVTGTTQPQGHAHNPRMTTTRHRHDHATHDRA